MLLSLSPSPPGSSPHPKRRKQMGPAGCCCCLASSSSSDFGRSIGVAATASPPVQATRTALPSIEPNANDGRRRLEHTTHSTPTPQRGAAAVVVSAPFPQPLQHARRPPAVFMWPSGAAADAVRVWRGRCDARDRRSADLGVRRVVRSRRRLGGRAAAARFSRARPALWWCCI